MEATSRPRDPFGPDPSPRVWRRVAGVVAAVALPAALVAVLARDLAGWAALAVAAAVLVGVPLSLAVAGTLRRPVAAQVAVGAVVGAAFGLAAAWTAPQVAVGVLLVVLAAAGGTAAASVAVRIGAGLPDPAVPGVVASGLLVAVGVVAFGLWTVLDPARGTDLVEVAATPEVDEAYGDGEGLAEAIAAEYERARQAGLPVLGARTWVAVVGSVLEQPLGDGQLRARTTPNLDLPTDPATGQPRRLISTVVRDREPAGCVEVTREAVRVHRQVCHSSDPVE